MTDFKTPPRPVETAPKDGRLLRLLVKDGSSPTEDDDTFWTIGSNSFDHTTVDAWDIVGWNWCQDCFTHTDGTVIGWLPFMPEEQE